MQRLPLQSRTFEQPTTVTLEASWDVILEQHLSMLEGEQFDRVPNVISISVDPIAATVTLETVRSLEAMRRGVPNAGRGTFVVPIAALEHIYV